MKTLIVNASQLLTLTGRKKHDGPRSGDDMEDLFIIEKGAVLVEEGAITGVGPTSDMKSAVDPKGTRVIDARQRVVMPAFADSHTHPLFASSRVKDFEMRILGKSYKEIADSGGGILSSVAKVRGMIEKDLVENLKGWARKFLECGTTTIEAKSGYGLNPDSEIKMLRVLRKVGNEGPIEIVPTFLGAHAVPPEYEGRVSAYVDMLIHDILGKIAENRLAEFVDVFCEDGYFPEVESERYLLAAEERGFNLKIHANQFGRTGGARVAARVRAVSADHLDHLSADEIGMLRKSGVIACLLPASGYFLSKPYPPARALISGGVPVALATDFNPGTSPCWNMQMVLSIACTQMKMKLEEAIIAATVNGAYAMGRGKRLGTIEPGKQADLLIMDARDYREIPYYFGANGCLLTMKRGEVVHESPSL